MSKEAMKLALEALESLSMNDYSGYEISKHETYKIDNAITALTEALAEQPAQKRPQNCGTGYCSCIECVMEPEQQEPEQQEPDWKYRLIAQHEETILWQAKRIAELLDAPQPPAQPIIKSYLEKDNSAHKKHKAWLVEFENGEQELHFEEQSVGETQIPLYIFPPAQRTWVGLTDEGIWLEYQNFWPFHPAEEPTLAKDIAKFARAIEAALRSKNT